MTVEANKDIVLRFLASSADGNPDLSLLADKATWWVPGLGVVPAIDIIAVTKDFWQISTPPMLMTPSAVTAEDDRVAVEAEGYAKLHDGRVYNNTYHFLFRISHGQIQEVREHNNTIIPAQLFPEGKFE